MRKSRELLLRMYHDPGYRFTDVGICYINRGAPGDLSCIGGDRILRLDPYYIEIASEKGTTPIPFHRLIRICYHGEVVWDRGKQGKSGSSSP